MQVVAGSNPSCHISLQCRYYFCQYFFSKVVFFLQSFFQGFIRFVTHASFFKISNVNLIYMRKVRVRFRVRVSPMKDAIRTIKDATDRLRFLNAHRRHIAGKNVS